MTGVTSDTTTERATAHAGRGKGDGYHHGDLPNALRTAGVELIAERGLGGFSLREVARRAGVSHTAPAHHFGDVKGLLTSIAAEGFDELHLALEEAMATGGDDPVERLVAIGRAYVDFARSNPGHGEVMFRTDIIDDDDADLAQCGLEAYADLERSVQALIDAEGLTVGVDEASWLCWSAMQGLVELSPKLDRMSLLRDTPSPSVDDLIVRFTHLMVDGLRHAT